jgi:hypothetical protein
VGPPGSLHSTFAKTPELWRPVGSLPQIFRINTSVANSDDPAGPKSPGIDGTITQARSIARLGGCGRGNPARTAAGRLDRPWRNLRPRLRFQQVLPGRAGAGCLGRRLGPCLPTKTLRNECSGDPSRSFRLLARLSGWGSVCSRRLDGLCDQKPASLSADHAVFSEIVPTIRASQPSEKPLRTTHSSSSRSVSQ